MSVSVSVRDIVSSRVRVSVRASVSVSVSVAVRGRVWQPTPAARGLHSLSQFDHTFGASGVLMMQKWVRARVRARGGITSYDFTLHFL